jgi:hypothetical protein
MKAQGHHNPGAKPDLIMIDYDVLVGVSFSPLFILVRPIDL